MAYTGTTGADHYQRKNNSFADRAVSTKINVQPSTTGPGNVNRALNAVDLGVSGTVPSGTTAKTGFQIGLNGLVNANGTVGPTPKIPFFKTSN